MSPDEIVVFLTEIEGTIEQQIGELNATLALVRDKKKHYLPAENNMCLKVPWLSQLSETAGYARGDCGTALIAMLLHWRGQDVTVDDVSKATGKPAGFTLLSFGNLANAALHFGLVLIYQRNLTIPQMIAEIDAGQPVIALLNYQSIPSMLRFDSKYNAGHYVLVVGYDAHNILYHDPYWPTEQGGAFKAMTRTDFEIAYSTIAPGNTYARHALKVT